MGEGELGDKGCAVFISEPRFEKLPGVLETGRDHGSPAAEDVALAKQLRSAASRTGRARSGQARPPGLPAETSVRPSLEAAAPASPRVRTPNMPRELHAGIIAPVHAQINP